MYSAFGNIPESRVLSPEMIGLTDDAVLQFRQALYRVGTGKMTIDEAVAGYGSFAQ
jgi:multiple sugar transport system substrate-binding protein